ncbi:DUF4190 domain-containing protein [Nocardioides sp. GY 10127]|uniref:DUF4190 domain-containing protein n=1 Tax=Nocardioides sp. GY 10127 TaxID=2569762 RepID=UPI0010A7CE1F|nr:DUF4190 domain-containing protein [Nocardioides sp. GY 10127]TIC81013.1 DUF4190 domain-containing protein [Nocardioides sp. GY 10127]
MSYDAPPPYPPYGQQPGQPYGAPPNHPQGTTILVLGILSLVFCCFGLLPGIPAWVMGQKARKEVAGGAVYANAGLITAGWICGIIGTCLSALFVCYLLFVLIVSVASGSGY